jgi:hypothetical protein
MEVESITARDHSILLAAWSLFSSTSCRRFHTPRLFQSRRRRQQVMPLPQPISRGSRRWRRGRCRRGRPWGAMEYVVGLIRLDVNR